jgi:hypothetical protein
VSQSNGRIRAEVIKNAENVSSKRGDITGEWRELHNTEPLNF